MYKKEPLKCMIYINDGAKNAVNKHGFSDPLFRIAYPEKLILEVTGMALLRQRIYNQPKHRLIP
jgi:hypothetical protein